MTMPGVAVMTVAAAAALYLSTSIMTSFIDKLDFKAIQSRNFSTQRE